MAHDRVDGYLRLLAEKEGGTDLHLKVGSPPRLRIKGSLEAIPDEPALDKAALDAMAAGVLTSGAKDHFLENREAECTYSVHGLGRFRVAAYLQRGSIALILRRVTMAARSLAELGLPAEMGELAAVERGLLLVAGPAGSGVTTTLAALVDHINHTRACHIVTVEDPVEVLHKDDLAAISQRQVGTDTPSVAFGVRSALRQDPDVVVIGDIDGRDVADAALAASEAGCVVIAGVRAGDVPAAVSAVVAHYPDHDQPHARLALAGALVGAVSIRLVPAKAGAARVPAVELLRVTAAVQAAIMGDEPAELRAAMVQTLNDALAGLLEGGAIDERAALAATPDWPGFRAALEARGLM